MTRHTLLLFVAGLGLLAGHCAQAQVQAPAAPTITIKDLGLPCADCNEGERAKIRSGGRTYANMHQWPGAYWEADITGPSFMVVFNGKENIFGVYADGRKIDTQTKAIHVIQYSGLSDGPHHVRIETQTESQSSEYPGVTDIEVPFKTPTLPAPLPRARQIEFIGDSYTVGYGNTSGKHQCTGDEIWATTDTSQAFGPLTARHYNADYQINAYSGRGVVRNWDGGAGDPLPVLYKYAIFDPHFPYRDDPTWRPQIVVIGLGTNDFSTQLHASEKWPTRDALHADYEATYVKFVQNLRARNPNAFFILMASDQVGGEIQSEVQKVIASLQAKGESRIAFIGLRNLDYMGCNWHPSTADDMLISQSLTTFIDAHPDLWQGK